MFDGPTLVFVQHYIGNITTSLLVVAMVEVLAVVVVWWCRLLMGVIGPKAK